MGRHYYLENNKHRIELLYSTNGNYFWKMSIEEMLTKVYVNGWKIITGDDVIALNDFLCYDMNGPRHVFQEEYVKFEEYYKHQNVCFPTYDSTIDDKVYKFVEPNQE